MLGLLLYYSSGKSHFFDKSHLEQWYYSLCLFKQEATNKHKKHCHERISHDIISCWGEAAKDHDSLVRSHSLQLNSHQPETEKLKLCITKTQKQNNLCGCRYF